MKAIEFNWHNFFVRDTNISSICIIAVTLKAVNFLRLIQNMSNGYDYMQLVSKSTQSLTLEST